MNRVMNGFRGQAPNPNKMMSKRPTMMGASKAPAAMDWNDRGFVSPVKDQGLCGSCYAFSASGALESHYAISKNVFTNLSEQNLLDCTSNYWGYGNDGCKGGFMDNVFEYIVDNKGIEGAKTYPYTGNVSFILRSV